MAIKYNPDTLNVDILIRRAICYRELNDHINSISDYSRLIELIPDYHEGILQRNIELKKLLKDDLQKKDIKNALVKLEKAVNNGYNNKEFLLNGNLFVPISQNPKFKELIEKISKTDN